MSPTACLSPVPGSAKSLSGDRSRWSKDPQVTAFRHELCEQIQRLGGVVTIAEIIDLTILLRPAANTLDSSQQQRMASAVARAAVETEDMMAQRRFQMRRVAGKIVVACSKSWPSMPRSWDKSPINSLRPIRWLHRSEFSKSFTKSSSRHSRTGANPSATNGS